MNDPAPPARSVSKATRNLETAPSTQAPDRAGDIQDGVPGTPSSETRSQAGRALLRAEGLGIELGRHLVVDGLDFTIEPGQLVTLSGPNGSGKTSVLRAILGELPHRGSLFLHPTVLARGIGYLPQVFTFDPSLPITVADLFGLSTTGPPLFFRRLFSKPRLPSPRTTLLERVGASGLERRLLGQLSGGELRRVLLAVAMLGNPALLLLDEPAASVDDAGAERFDELLIGLRRQQQGPLQEREENHDRQPPALLVVHHGRPRLEEAADLRLRLASNPPPSPTGR